MALDKARTVKRALRMIGVNYTNVTTNKNVIEEEAYDIFKDIVLDILSNRNYQFNVKQVIPTEAPPDAKLEASGIVHRRFYIPGDFLNLVECVASDVSIEGGMFVTAYQATSWYVGGSEDFWVKYCFKGDETLIPDYFSRYVSLKLAYELAMVFYPSDLEKQSKLDREYRRELVAIDRTQMTNRPMKVDGSDLRRLGKIRGR